MRLFINYCQSSAMCPSIISMYNYIYHTVVELYSGIFFCFMMAYKRTIKKERGTKRNKWWKNKEDKCINQKHKCE